MITQNWWGATESSILQTSQGWAARGSGRGRKDRQTDRQRDGIHFAFTKEFPLHCFVLEGAQTQAWRDAPLLTKDCV